MRVSFKTEMNNREYRFGETKHPPTLEVAGTGTLITFLGGDPLVFAVVKTDDGVFYKCEMQNVKELKGAK